MMTFVKIAWRNILRNKYRSILTISAIAVGLTAMIFLRAFLDGADQQMITNYTDLVSGHVQVHKKDFHKKMGLERSLTEAEDIERVLAQTPQVISHTRRVKEFVLASSAEQSSGVLVIGIDPEKETAVTQLHKRIRKGEFLKPGENDRIIVGKDLLEILNVELNDKIVLMGQGADGSLASGLFRISGILDTGVEGMDKGAVLITLEAAQEFLVLHNKISEITVKTHDIYQSAAVAKILKKKLGTDLLEVLTWEEIEPFLHQIMQFDKMFLDFILLIFLIIVAAGILNTILMGVFQRIREFGVMLALGTKRWQIIWMVGVESFLLGLAGTVMGLVIGLSISLSLGKYGINVGIFGDAFDYFYIGSVVYPRVFFQNIWISASAGLIVSIAASIYPAWRASKLKPSDAIRQI